MFEEATKTAVNFMAQGVEALTALLILVASLRAFVHYFGDLLRGRQPFPGTSIRLSLGRSLALALELALGADILKTAVAPTWNDIGQLAAIATIRTALNFFLERELRAEEGAPPESPLPAAPPKMGEA